MYCIIRCHCGCIKRAIDVACGPEFIEQQKLWAAQYGYSIEDNAEIRRDEWQRDCTCDQLHLF